MTPYPSRRRPSGCNGLINRSSITNSGRYAHASTDSSPMGRKTGKRRLWRRWDWNQRFGSEGGQGSRQKSSLSPFLLPCRMSSEGGGVACGSSSENSTIPQEEDSRPIFLSIFSFSFLDGPLLSLRSICFRFALLLVPLRPSVLFSREHFSVDDTRFDFYYPGFRAFGENPPMCSFYEQVLNKLRV